MRGRSMRKQEASVPPRAVPPIFLLTLRPGAQRRGLIPSGICSNTKKEKDHDNTNRNDQRETDTGLLHLRHRESDGKKENKRVGAAFAHKKGTGFSFLINGKRYAAFPPKVKTAAK